MHNPITLALLVMQLFRKLTYKFVAFCPVCFKHPVRHARLRSFFWSVFTYNGVLPTQVSNIDYSWKKKIIKVVIKRIDFHHEIPTRAHTSTYLGCLWFARCQWLPRNKIKMNDLNKSKNKSSVKPVRYVILFPAAIIPESNAHHSYELLTLLSVYSKRQTWPLPI